MENSGGSGFKLNQFEYCYLVEDTDPCAREMKIYVPKLQAQTTGSSKSATTGVDQSSFMNADDCKLQSSNKVESAGYIVAPVALELAHRHKIHDCPGNCPNATHDAVTCHTGTSHLKPCPHFHHDHHFPHDESTGMIPANTQMICMFMGENATDCIITRMWCKFPDGTIQPGNPPDEHR